LPPETGTSCSSPVTFTIQRSIRLIRFLPRLRTSDSAQAASLKTPNRSDLGGELIQPAAKGVGRQAKLATKFPVRGLLAEAPLGQGCLFARQIGQRPGCIEKLPADQVASKPRCPVPHSSSRYAQHSADRGRRLPSDEYRLDQILVLAIEQLRPPSQHLVIPYKLFCNA